MSKRIAIVGAGAVGSHVGGYLVKSGHEVIFIDPWPEHVEVMRNDGLTLAGLTEPECFTVAVRALHLTELECLSREPGIDIAFVCTKSYDTEWATVMIRQYLAPDGFVVSLQNGINEDRIARIVGWGRTVGCIASMISVELHAPGQVRRNVTLGGERHTVFRVGEAHGRITPRIEEVAEMVSAADSSKATGNLWGERWSKLVANSMRNGLYAAAGLAGGAVDLMDTPRIVALKLATEAVVVGRAQGFVLETIYGQSPDALYAAGTGDVAAFKELEASLIERARKSNAAATHRPSMAQDMAKGRRTEIEFLNGLVVERGELIGVPTPTNRAMIELVQRVERREVEASVELLNALM